MYFQQKQLLYLSPVHDGFKAVYVGVMQTRAIIIIIL